MFSYPQPGPPGPVAPTPAPAPSPVAPTPVPTPPLPLRRSTSIQGNVLAAYNKDHQCFLLYHFGDQGQGRLWLGAIAAQVAATGAVEDYNDMFRAARDAGTQLPPATWINVGLTAQGLLMLAGNAAQVGADLTPFSTFTAGPAARATALGDTGASDPARWQFGGPSNAPIHAVVTVAADAATDRDGKLAALDQLAQQHGITLVGRLDGDALAGTMAGHEHFGHKDGISQPGVRDFHEPDPNESGRAQRPSGHPAHRRRRIRPGLPRRERRRPASACMDEGWLFPSPAPDRAGRPGLARADARPATG